LSPKAATNRVVEEIKSRLDLVDLIGEYIRLEKKGKNYTGLCPFHQEKTPSFTVSPDKQLYHCFGCGEGGDHFKFIMNLENFDFPEALRFLAERAGVSLPQQEKSSSAALPREVLFNLNQLALNFFRYVLNSPEGNSAREYLQKRGMTGASIEKFELGYAPAKWETFLKIARKKGFSLENLQQAGLIVERRDGGGYYDRFRNRVMFPIFDVKGKVVGFGGRSLEEAPHIPKYLNSPQTPLFDKGKFLYGIYQAKSAIRKEGRAVIMEGYTDVISCYQEGIENGVASLGTALTPQQARLLRFQTSEVVMAYDADEGGKAATARGMEILRNGGLKVKIAELPRGYDPDGYLKEKGADAFKRLIDESVYFMDYQIEKLKEKYNLATAEGKASFCEEYLPLLVNAGHLEREHYLKELAEDISISEEVLREELKKYRLGRSRTEKYSNNLSITGKNNIIQDKSLDSAEELLLKLLISFEGVFEKVAEVNKTDIFTPQMKKIVEACRILTQNDETVNVNSLLNMIEEEDLHKLITQASFDHRLETLEEEEINRMVDDCLRKLQEKKLRERRSDIERELKELDKGGDRERIKALFQEWEKIKSAERELYRGVEKEGWSW